MDDMQLARLVRRSILTHTWADTKRFLELHPELLTDRADRVMVRFLSDAEEAGNETLAGALRQHRQLLLRSREMGIEAAFQEAQEARFQEHLVHLATQLGGTSDSERFDRDDEDEPDPGGAFVEMLQGLVGPEPATPTVRDTDVAEPDGPLSEAERSLRSQLLTDAARGFAEPEDRGPLMEAVEALVGARSLVAAEHAGAQHPALLSDRADELLGSAVGTARERGEERVARCFEGHRHLLGAYRRSRPFRSPAAGGSGGARMPEEVVRLVEEAEAAGDPQRQLVMLERAVALVSRTKDPHGWAALNTQLGLLLLDLYGAAGDPDHLRRAVACFNAALERFTRETLPGEWAMLQFCLAMAFGQRFDDDRAANLETAIEHVQAALEVCTAEMVPADWAKGQVILGTIYADPIREARAHDLEQAIGCLRAVLAVLTAEEDPAEWIDAQVSLGNAYLVRVLGDRDANVERSIACFEAVSAVANRAPSQAPFPAPKLQANRNLGVALTIRAAGDGVERADVPELERAVAHLNSVLATLSLEESPYQWASTYAALGDAYAALAEAQPDADPQRAVACYDAAQTVLTHESFPADWARIQHNLGGLYANLARRDPRERDASLARAVGSFQDALAVFEVSGTPTQRRLTGSMLGQAAAEAGRWEEAAHGYRVALDAHEALYGTALLRSAKAAELAEVVGLPQRAAYALARCGRRGEAVLALEQGRARWLAEVVTRERLSLEEAAGRDPAAVEAFRRAAERWSAVEAAHWRGASAIPMFPGGLDEIEDLERANRQAEEALRAEAEAAEAALADAIERIRAAGVQGFLAPPGPGDIAAVVTPDRPLAYISVSPVGSATLLVHRAGQTLRSGEAVMEDGGRDVTIDVVEALGDGPALAAELIALLVTQDQEGRIIGGYLPGLSTDLPSLPTDAVAWLPDALDELLPLLGQRLIGPLAARLAELGAQGVTLVACGGLGLLPLHAAPYQRDGLDRCLLDDLDVSYTPSARALRASLSALLTREGLPTLAGVGNPLPVPKSLPPIESGEAELDAVAACFDHGAELLFGVAASKAALLSAARGATHVHLACHGLLRPDQPLSSALVLADGDRLTLTEMLAERPFANARLVAASACRTAVTDFGRFLDEELGLPASFLQAGAAGVVATLWRVNSASAALLMTSFYEHHLRGVEGDTVPVRPARALRRAQCWLRDLTVEQLGVYVERHPQLRGAAVVYLQGAASWRPFKNPYHWAPYVMVGA